MKNIRKHLGNKYRSKTPKGFYHAVKGHTGEDYIVASGNPITLPIETTVANWLMQTEMGSTLYLKDENDNILVFAHLSEVFFKKGQKVPANTVFAKTGNSGSATTGPHLHFEIISQVPEDKVMTRSLGGFEGYNIAPGPYLDKIYSLPEEDDDYTKNQKIALNKLLEKGWITSQGDPKASISRGDLAIILARIHNL